MVSYDVEILRLAKRNNKESGRKIDDAFSKNSLGIMLSKYYFETSLSKFEFISL